MQNLFFFSFILVIDGQYYNSSPSPVCQLDDLVSYALVKNSVLYVSGFSPGQIVRATTSVASTSYPYPFTAISSNLKTPQGNFAIDSQGNMYISDSEGHAVRKYTNIASATYTTIAGTGTAGSAMNQLNGSIGITLDETENNMFVVDSKNHRVMKYSVGGKKGANGILVAVCCGIDFVLLDHVFIN